MHVKSSKCKKLHGREVCYFLTQKTLNRSLLGMCISKCMFDSVLCIQDCREKKKNRQGFQCFIYFAELWLQRWKFTQNQIQWAPVLAIQVALKEQPQGLPRCPDNDLSRDGWITTQRRRDKPTFMLSHLPGLFLPQGQGLCVQLFMFLIKTPFQDSEIRPSQTFWVS